MTKREDFRLQGSGAEGFRFRRLIVVWEPTSCRIDSARHRLSHRQTVQIRSNSLYDNFLPIYS